jgi:pSer/pThr/pTyr-binding forkhead associated (FHA) protein
MPPAPGQVEEKIPQGAFLMVAGTRIFPLQGYVVNIGRSPNNDLQIEDPKISRSHAQLRFISGRYVIFDLDSTGGTFVNGQRIQQSQLYPGDVITLAGVPLVFGQDAPGQAGDTQPYNPDMDQGIK